MRRVASIDRRAHPNEVFLDEVRVPVGLLVGTEHRGWDCAKFLLGNERTGIGRARERIRHARALAAGQRSQGQALDHLPTSRERAALLECELRALEIIQLRVVASQDGANRGRASGGRPDPFSSVLKIKGSELQQAAHELARDTAGPAAMPAWAEELAALSNALEAPPTWTRPLAPAYLFSRAAAIYGGSNEIQKTILARSVLGL